MNKEFDYTKFKEEFNSGDLNGLEYLEKTTIDGSFAKADNFDYDLYFNTRDLLFKELGFDIDKLCE